MIASRHLSRTLGQVPIILIGGSLIWKFPDTGADQIVAADPGARARRNCR